MKRSTHPLAIKSQNWLVEALLELIQQKPYEEITISEIARKAKLDRRTFYRNFKDKEDVLSYYFNKLKEEYILMLKGVSQHNFYTLAKSYLDFWNHHREFLKTAQQDEVLKEMLMDMINQFMPTIYAQADGTLSYKLHYNIAFVTGGFHNVLMHWMNTGFKETPEEIVRNIAGMFDDSIAYWPDL